jgi:two-component system, OmpR family, KDP operon response regulator KdpE
MSSQKRLILIADDEIQVQTIVRRTLELEGYRVITANDGEEALSLFEEQTPDLALLDIMMPGMDGFALCERIREFSQVPIIMLTSKSEEEDKLRGFELGIDDYIPKPFSRKELIARIKAVLRRSRSAAGPPAAAIYKSNSLEINFARRRLVRNGQEIALTPTEYRLLEELVSNRGKVLTYAHLLQKVWGPEYRDEKQYLHVFVGNLRTKIESDPAHPDHIHNAFGVGYEFRD